MSLQIIVQLIAFNTYIILPQPTVYISLLLSVVT